MVAMPILAPVAVPHLALVAAVLHLDPMPRLALVAAPDLALVAESIMAIVAVPILAPVAVPHLALVLHLDPVLLLTTNQVVLFKDIFNSYRY